MKKIVPVHAASVNYIVDRMARAGIRRGVLGVGVLRLSYNNLHPAVLFAMPCN